MEATFNKVRTLAEHPQYFGTYLNMARHNIFLIGNDLALKFGFEGMNDDEEVTKKEKFFLLNELKDNPNHIFSILKKRLPITKVFSSDDLPKTERKSEGFELEGVDFKALVRFFEASMLELEEFRNDYSHYFSKDFNKKEIHRKLNIRSELASFLRNNLSRAIEYTKSRFDGVFNDSDFEITRKFPLVDAEDRITEKGLVFFICLFLEKESAIQFINRVKGFKNTSTREFIATREAFTAFTATLPSDKFISDNSEQALQLDLLNYLSRCPDELFSVLTEEGKSKFQPDLGIPEFENIVKTSQLDENSDIPDIEEHVRNLSTQKRHGDRFELFALNFLSNSDSFLPEFQINLGKAMIKSYSKSIAGNSFEREVVNEVRVFGKLSDYKQDTDYTLLQKEEPISKSIFLNDGVKFIQYAPHFNNENNKININLTGATEERKYHKTKVAEASLSIKELPKVVLLELMSKGKATEIITEFLAKNNDYILNLDFINEIKEQLDFKPLKRNFFTDKLEIFKKDDPILLNLDLNISKINGDIKSLKKDNEIRNAKAKLNSLFYAKYQNEVGRRKVQINQLLKTYKLNERQIPSKILDFWLNIIETETGLDLKTRIKADKKDCKERYKKLLIGKGPKVGEMATFIAKDIVKMIVSLDVKNKVTSFYYDKMQECLALYADPEKRELFNDIVSKELGLIDKSTGHPFLADLKITQISKTKEFYKKYLEEKVVKVIKKPGYDRFSGKPKVSLIEDGWIVKTFYQRVRNEETGRIDTIIEIPQNKPVPFIYRKIAESESPTLEQWLNNVKHGKKYPKNANPKAKVVDLPTNLFDADLVDILCSKVGVKNDGTYNFSKLMSMWVTDKQPFYDYQRCYKVYEYDIKFDVTTQKPIKEYYQGYSSDIFEKLKKDRELENRELSKSGDKKKPMVQKGDLELVLKKSIEGNEKVIRHYLLKDRITLLMFKELFPADSSLFLSDFQPFAESSPLSKFQDLKEIITLETQFDDEGKYISDKRRSERKSVTKTIMDTNRKLKDFGLFRKFVKDKRLPELFFYFQTNEIPLEILKAELFQYNKYQALVLDKVFELESSIINIASETDLETLKAAGSYSNIQHKPYLEFLRKKNMVSLAEMNFLALVRNKFSHSQFPPKVIMDMHINWQKEKDYSEQIYLAYSAKVDHILKQIKNG